jgi:hypothetical protein
MLVAAVAMASDASWAITVSAEGTVRTWGTGAAATVIHGAVPTDGSQPVAVARAGDRVRVLWADREMIRLHETVRRARPRDAGTSAPAPVQALALSPAGVLTAVACADGHRPGRRGLPRRQRPPLRSRLGDIGHDGRRPQPPGDSWPAAGRFRLLGASITAIAVDGTGRRVLASRLDGTLWLHDMAGGPATELRASETSPAPDWPDERWWESAAESGAGLTATYRAEVPPVPRPDSGAPARRGAWRWLRRRR